MSRNTKDTQQNSLSWGQMICSTLAATFGVQSQANRERDFTRGEFGKFVVVAIGFTFVILITLIGIVQLVMSNS